MHDHEYNHDINFIGYFRVIKKHYRLIVIIIAASVLITAFISFTSPEIYKATAVISPSVQPRENSNMSALAAQFGISTASSSNDAEIIRLLQSNILMEKVMNEHNLLPVLFDKNKLKEIPDISKTWSGIRRLKGIFNIRQNRKDGMIEVSAEHTDPELTAKLVNYLLVELNEYISSEVKRVAETNKKYLESLISKNSDPLIDQKIYSLIAKQIEMSMMAEVKENFIFKIIDPPRVPDMKIKPLRRQSVILAFIISLFAGIIMAFIVEYIQSVRRQELEAGGN